MWHLMREIMELSTWTRATTALGRASAACSYKLTESYWRRAARWQRFRVITVLALASRHVNVSAIPYRSIPKLALKVRQCLPCIHHARLSAGARIVNARFRGRGGARLTVAPRALNATISMATLEVESATATVVVGALATTFFQWVRRQVWVSARLAMESQRQIVTRTKCRR